MIPANWLVEKNAANNSNRIRLEMVPAIHLLINAFSKRTDYYQMRPPEPTPRVTQKVFTNIVLAKDQLLILRYRGCWTWLNCLN